MHSQYYKDVRWHGCPFVCDAEERLFRFQRHKAVESASMRRSVTSQKSYCSLERIPCSGTRSESLGGCSETPYIHIIVPLWQPPVVRRLPRSLTYLGFHVVDDFGIFLNWQIVPQYRQSIAFRNSLPVAAWQKYGHIITTVSQRMLTPGWHRWLVQQCLCTSCETASLFPPPITSDYYAYLHMSISQVPTAFEQYGRGFTKQGPQSANAVCGCRHLQTGRLRSEITEKGGGNGKLSFNPGSGWNEFHGGTPGRNRTYDLRIRNLSQGQ